jgi:septum formation topological specificity factor MinE
MQQGGKSTSLADKTFSSGCEGASNSLNSEQPDFERTFVDKLKAIWRILFPKPYKHTVQSIARARLTACLTLDRASFHPDKLREVKSGVVDVLSKYLHIGDHDSVQMELVGVR